MRVEIQGVLDGYVVFDLEEKGVRETVSSDANLRSYLQERDVSEWRINSAIEDLKHPPRKIIISV